ncbi:MULTISPECIES: ABC transporter ATP-binding protein [Sporosarcina]|uniref:ATP-binding cassette domain-containing protein n=1 Tax=Sporosarcina contaminans TaxID=633403 RepID=A0ABW3TZQ5_9BACL
MANVLEAIQVSKDIDGRSILQNISFQCSNDTRLLIRGKNGSGKSTLLKLLAGIIKPSSGKIAGSAQKVGYVPEHFPEGLRFRLKEYLLLTSSFQAGSKEIIEGELSNYIQMFGIEPFLQTPLKACSKGTRQKAGIIQALLMKPDVLLLDEPLTGLDIESQQILVKLLEGFDIPIIFTSHEDELLMHLAKEVLHIGTGEVTPYFIHAAPKKRIKVEYSSKEVFKDFPVNEIQYEGSEAIFIVDGETSDQILIELLQKNCSIVDVREIE